MAWDLSCPDWERRLKDGRVPIRDDLPLDMIEGERAVSIFKKLRLADVPGMPTMEEAGAEWLFTIVRTLFGSLDSATMTRAIVELFLLVPKKNSKTTGGALMMLVALLMNRRPRGPFALMAPVQDTADEAFEAAAGAIALDPVLDKKFHVRDHLKTIIHRETKADLKIMTFDPDVLTGKKFVGVLIDELHVIAKNSKAAKAMRQVRGGMVPFPEAFLAFITTMPDERPSGVMLAELQKARDIRDGKREGKMLPVLYELPREIQEDAIAWRDPAAWAIVTPNLGRSVTIEKLQELYQDALAKGPDEVRGWASQHLNIEIGLALHSNSWAGAAFWEAQGDPDVDLEAILARCEVVVVGCDGGGLDDLFGLAILGRERVTGRWLHWGHAWAHRIALERRKEIAPELQDHASRGDLTIVDSPGQDIAEAADIICRVASAGLLPEKSAIGVDPVGIADLVDELLSAERGISQDQILGISQGWKLNAAIKTTERKLAGGDLVHGGAPLMAWCVGNARVEPKGNAILITKQASGSAKIDPLMALFDAVALLALNPQPPKSGEFQLFIA